MSRNETTWADREETDSSGMAGLWLKLRVDDARNEGRVSNDLRTNKRRINA